MKTQILMNIKHLILLLSFTLLIKQKVSFAQDKIIRNIVFEGGGIKGIAYGGALKELENRGVLKGITRSAGTSAGAIQACLLSLGYSADEILNIISNTPVESFNDDGFVVKASKRLFKEFGWFKGESFLKKMEAVIFERTGNPNLTFAELHKLANTYPFRDLYVTGCNLSQQKLVVFSHETHPNMRIADAVRVSMSIPIYYKGIWLNKEGKVFENFTDNEDVDLYVDGGLLANFPIDIFDNTKYLGSQEEVQIFNGQTLGMRLERCSQIDHEVLHKKGLAPFKIADFNTYMAALSGIIMRNINVPNPKDSERTIYINDLGLSARVRKVENDEKNQMIVAGQQGVIDFFVR